MENQLYICHYCVKYTTWNRKDMKKHFNRKKECKCMNLLSYEKAKELTLSKKFIFSFDYQNLLFEDYKYIITFYTDKINFIDKNFKNQTNNYSKESNHIFNYEESSESEIDENMEDEEIDESFNEDCKNKKLINIEFDSEYFKSELNKYVCPKCGSEYKSKYNLIKHMKNKKLCEYNQTVNKLIYESKEIAQIKKEKELKEKEEIEKHIFQNIGTQNINIQNNNNNSNNNTYNFQMKDFVHDHYDLTHIKDSFYQQKDFFIYNNFLKIIMENKKNHNIFFANNQAIIYTDNELNKMNSDKAGYLVLDKLSQSFNQIINKQDKEVQDYYAFITKYYSVLKGQYKHDTIYKDYGVDERRFFYTANSGMFRSRDKYLSKMVSTMKPFSDEIREKMSFQGEDVKDIPSINPSIEDFASVKMRYRDLKDKD